MYSLDKRQILIIKLLINSQEPISSDALAGVLGSNGRTVRTDLKVIENILHRFGAKVVSKSGKGNVLEITDHAEFNVFLQSFNEKYNDDNMIPFYNPDRIRFIMYTLLNNDFIKSEELEEDLFISKTTLYLDMKKVRELLEFYHLEIIQRPNYGIHVNGLERHLRVALSDYMYVDEENISAETDSIVYRLDHKAVLETLTEQLRKHNIHISMASLTEIQNYIIVSEYRFHMGKYVTYDDFTLHAIKAYEEYSMVETALKKLWDDVTESEIANICLYIISRRVYGLDDSFDLNENMSNYFLADEILKYLFTHTKLDFTIDRNLILLLSRLLRGLLVRLNYGFEYRNMPIVSTKQNNTAFEYAILICDFLMKRYSYHVHEEEIVAMANFLQRQLLSSSVLSTDEYPKQRLCVVCYKGKNTALIISHILFANYREYIEMIDFKEYYELSDADQNKYDLIITDIPKVKFNVHIPIYQLIYNFDSYEKKQIYNLLCLKKNRTDKLLNIFHENLFFKDVNLNSKEKVLQYMAQKMTDSRVITDNFFDSILQRESKSSTERGNIVALSHSLFPVTDHAVASIAILKKPILWDKELVQIVFLIAIGSEESNIFENIEMLQQLIGNISFIYKLLKAESCQEITEEIGRAYLELEGM